MQISVILDPLPKLLASLYSYVTLRYGCNQSLVLTVDSSKKQQLLAFQ